MPSATPDTQSPSRIKLIGYTICPYVQRTLITLHEKRIPHEVEYIELYGDARPDWLTRLSPLGKVPVLLVEDTALFESLVIVEYLDEIAFPRLHPADPLPRARHRAWMAFASTIQDDINDVYNAKTPDALEAARLKIAAKLEQVEGQLCDGPYFAGPCFSLVDAVFAPVFILLDRFERYRPWHFFAATPKVAAWKAALLEHPAVLHAIHPEYDARLTEFLRRKDSLLSRDLR